MRCSVLGCKSDSERKIPNMSFHSFPDNDLICRKWIEATGRTNWIAKKSSRICSRHFEQNVLIKKKKITVLLPNAVPLLEIETCFPSTSFSVSSHTEGHTKTPTPTTLSSINPHIHENMDIDDSEAQIEFPEEQPPFQLMEDSLLSHSVTEPKSAKSPNYTPRTMRKKLKRTREQSAERLKKLKALREKSRRLNKKVANLENVIAELKARSFVTEEDEELLKSIDPFNKDFLTKFLKFSWSGRKFSPALRKFALCLNINTSYIAPKSTMQIV